MDWDAHGKLRPLFDGPYRGVAGFTRTSAAEAIAEGRVDVVAFGQLMLANPDLVERFRNGWPLNRPDPATYYTQGEAGYINYPFYSAEAGKDLVEVDSMATPLPGHK